jgi:hypothetical protein
MLAEIRLDYKVELTWYGTAAGTQAGFVLPSSLLADLADLGLDVNCTVYGHDDTSERPGSHMHDNQPAARPTGLRQAGPVLDQQAVDRLIAQQLVEQRLAD